jgi:hypothetical protein
LREPVRKTNDERAVLFETSYRASSSSPQDTHLRSFTRAFRALGWSSHSYSKRLIPHRFRHPDRKKSRTAREYFRSPICLHRCRYTRGRLFKSASAMGTNEMGDFIKKNFDNDEVDRRGFLKCMAWAGTGRSASCKVEC